MLSCERLKAWELVDRLAHRVYDLTSSWPACERYGLVSQARRAAFSVAANICEGSSKRGSREYARYLDISVGSMAELTYTLRFARTRGWIDNQDWRALEELRDTASKSLWFLYQSVRRAAQRATPHRPSRPS
jgi:four helix bundle protein